MIEYKCDRYGKHISADWPGRREQRRCSSGMNNNWCESCARKNDCYAPNIRPKCYMPTTSTAIICPKCGRSDCIKSFVKDWGTTNSEFEYKCINCNTYFGFGRRPL